MQSIWFTENYFSVPESPGLFSREGRLSSQMMKGSPSILGLSRKNKTEHPCCAAEFSSAVLTHSPTKLMHIWVFVKASWGMYHCGPPVPTMIQPHTKTIPPMSPPSHFCPPVTMKDCHRHHRPHPSSAIAASVGQPNYP